MNKSLLFICGPTATGKTRLALKLAKQFNGQIVSCDSRQVYQHMDVVTGKDIPENFYFHNSQIKHSHLNIGYYSKDNKSKIWGYDLVLPNQEFHLQLYLEFIARIIPHIWKQNQLPIIVGGTGLYLKAIIDPPATIGIPPNPQLRAQLKALNTKQIYQKLISINKTKTLKLNHSEQFNRHRLIRAIEIATNTKKNNISSKLKNYISQCSQIKSLWIGMKPNNTQKLFKQIDNRVIDRLNHQNFIQELEYLLDNNYLSAAPSQTIGYRQIIQWMNLDADIKNLIDSWQTAEHQYAKRQLTWFKKQPNINWFDTLNSKTQEQIQNLITKQTFTKF